VNQGTFTQVGEALVDVVAEQAGASARFAVVSTDPGAFSQNSWIAAMKAQMQAKYPKMQLVDIRYGLGKPAESFSMAQDLITKFRGQLDAIVAPTVVGLPKVAEEAGVRDLLGSCHFQQSSEKSMAVAFRAQGATNRVQYPVPQAISKTAKSLAHDFSCAMISRI
jgi:ABC-type sugar transport system substrate-binding protein